MSLRNQALNIGLLTLVLGVALSAASAWCEFEAHLRNGQPVQELGKSYREAPSFYLASSMAIRLFSVGALFIVVGTLQIQRAKLSDRVSRLEQQLETLRKRAA